MLAWHVALPRQRSKHKAEPCRSRLTLTALLANQASQPRAPTLSGKLQLYDFLAGTRRTCHGASTNLERQTSTLRLSVKTVLHFGRLRAVKIVRRLKMSDTSSLWAFQGAKCATVLHFGRFQAQNLRQFYSLADSGVEICDNSRLWPVQGPKCATVLHFG